MYNSERKGTDAWFAMEDFVNASKTIDRASSDFEEAADNACGVIGSLTDDLEEKQEDIDRLEEEVDGLKDQLKVNDAIEFLRVLRNVQVYVADHIEVLEKKYGEVIEAKANSE